MDLLFATKNVVTLLLIGHSIERTSGAATAAPPILRRLQTTTSICVPQDRTRGLLNTNVGDNNKNLRGAGHRALNGWFPCGSNTFCVIGRAACAEDASGLGTCTCNDGYAGEECHPVDECETESPCPGGSVCVDMFPPMKFKCDCKAGFTPDLPFELPGEPNVPLANRPVTCIDRDECADSDNPPCHPDAVCTNTIGGFECLCNVGLVGNGISDCAEPPKVETVTDAPPPQVECSVDTDCQGANMQCVNKECSCRPGYAQVGPNCQNEVNCDVGGFNNDCHRRATCVEEEGFPGFSCKCVEGWKDAFEGANGKSCVDIPPVTEAPPPELTTEAPSRPEGVGPFPNRPTVFPPRCLADNQVCGPTISGTCCSGKCAARIMGSTTTRRTEDPTTTEEPTTTEQPTTTTKTRGPLLF